jgi:hypothetical protein
VNKTRPMVTTLLARMLAARVLAPAAAAVATELQSAAYLHRGSSCSSSCCRQGQQHQSPRLGGSSLRDRVPCTALCSSGALVRQDKQGGHNLHLMCRQFLQHLLITDPLSECHDNRCIENTWNGSTYLGEAGDEGPECFPGLLPHSVEVGHHAVLLVRTVEVPREQRAELSPGLDGSRGEIHEPYPGWPGQGYVEVTCHYGVVTSSRRDGGDVDLQEF